MNKIETFEELLKYAHSSRKRFYQISQEIEAENFEVSVNDVREKVKYNLNAMKEAIKAGLESSQMSMSGLSGCDCARLQARYSEGDTLFSKTYQKVLTYSLATIEQNARMGKIVACPTAGSCGIVPAVVIALSESVNADEETQINALITAGLIGKIISHKMALAGAVMGCQGECGVASAMAAGALVEIYDGEPAQILNAVALALKNVMGLVCDPVAGLVEVPCVKRNAFLSIYAVTAAELAMADIRSVIPVDEVVDAMKQVGQLMSSKLRESSEAGLAATETGLSISASLHEQWHCK